MKVDVEVELALCEKLSRKRVYTSPSLCSGVYILNAKSLFRKDLKLLCFEFDVSFDLLKRL